MEKKENQQSFERQRQRHTTQQHESEDATQRDELGAEPLTVPQESDEDDGQREEERAEPLTVPQENNEDGSQRQEQRAESFTMVQDNVPQEVDDVHSSHGLTEGQSIILILSFALRHNTTGVLMEDLLKLLILHCAWTSAVPTSKYFLEKPLTDILHQFPDYMHCVLLGVCRYMANLWMDSKSS